MVTQGWGRDWGDAAKPRRPGWGMSGAPPPRRPYPGSTVLPEAPTAPFKTVCSWVQASP